MLMIPTVVQSVHLPVSQGGNPNDFWYYLWRFTRNREINLLMQIARKAEKSITESDFRALQEGNRNSFHKVYDAYYPLIQFICRRCSLPQQLADEVTQETFLKLFSHARDLKSAGQVKSWLATTCRNACIDQIRHSKKNPLETAPGTREDSVQPDGAQESALREFELRIVSDFIEQVALEPGGETFALFYRDGKSVREIAASNDESVSSVTTRLTRLRRRFGNILRQRITALRDSSPIHKD